MAGIVDLYKEGVSTRSRPKAADFAYFLIKKNTRVSTRSRPKAAEALWYLNLELKVSTRSRPKAADIRG